MLNTFIQMLGIILGFFRWPLYIVIGIIAIFYIDCCFWYFWEFFRHGRRVKKGSIVRLPKRNFFLRLLYDAPRQYVRDIYAAKPDFFRPQGLVVFTGRQGNGKSIALMHYALELKDTYPLSKCISNTMFKYQDAPLKHWSQLINFKNEHKGVIVIMDELQNWFSSNQSKNFPPEMLSVITQNRKNRRVILGTAQNFYLLAKPIRSQCTEIRECMTLAGVITIVIRREPVVDNDGDVKQLKYRGMYFFVHSPRLRDSYDTYAVVDTLSKSGFHDNPFVKDTDKAIDIAIKK